MRSATRPQNCRLRKARPSSIESIAAPTDAEIPTSVQRATRWPCGIAIGTQHQKPAAASIDNAVAGRNPSAGAAGRDATDDPLHGHQEERFFHGYYDHYTAICRSMCSAAG